MRAGDERAACGILPLSGLFVRPSWNCTATGIVVQLVSNIKQSFLEPSKEVTVSVCTENLTRSTFHKI